MEKQPSDPPVMPEIKIFNPIERIRSIGRFVFGFISEEQIYNHQLDDDYEQQKLFDIE